MKTGQNLILNISLMGDGLISFNITGIGNYSIGCVFDGDSDYKSTNVTQNVSVIANVVQDGNNGFKDTSNQKSSSSQSNYYEDDHLSCEQLKAKYPLKCLTANYLRDSVKEEIME